jgi:hypothetical protein
MGPQMIETILKLLVLPPFSAILFAVGTYYLSEWYLPIGGISFLASIPAAVIGGCIGLAVAIVDSVKVSR